MWHVSFVLPEVHFHHSYKAHVWPILSACLFFFSFFCGLRVQTTAWWRSGEQMMAVCWPRCAATLPRSPTWPWATRTLWSLPAPVTKPSECGVYRPVRLWPFWRDTQPPSHHSRYSKSSVRGLVSQWKYYMYGILQSLICCLCSFLLSVVAQSATCPPLEQTAPSASGSGTRTLSSLGEKRTSSVSFFTSDVFSLCDYLLHLAQ